MTRRYFALLLASFLTVLSTAPAIAVPFDTPTVVIEDIGTGKVTLRVTAGASGMPSGFTIYWMTSLDYEDYGNVWPDNNNYPTLDWANFTGAPTLNTFDDLYTTFILGPNESMLIEIGDLEDESGLTTNTPEELNPEENYVFCVWANGGPGGQRSGFSLNGTGSTISKKSCIHSKGYWKTHSSQWPVNNLTLGTVNYTKAQLLQILNQSTNGNGLVSLAKQLIAAKLNIANGAIAQPIINTTIAAADAQIGALVVPPIGGGYLSPGSTSSKTQKLDDFNSGGKYSNGCGSTPTAGSSWGRIKSLYR